MSQSCLSMQNVLDSLVAEGLLESEARADADAVLETMQGVQPWYIRTMVGFGAWLASLLLIGFVGSIGIAADSGFAIIGAGLIVGSVLVRRQSGNDFLVQSAMACSLAGQAIFAYGVVEPAGMKNFDLVLAVVIAISALMFVIYPDRIHKVISVVVATTSLCFLLYAHELNAIVPVFGPALALVFVFLHQRQGAFIERGYGHLVRPLMTGTMLSAFGFLLLSTIYILPELGAETVFYPRPWISTILLGMLLLYVSTRLWGQLGIEGDRLGQVVFYSFVLATCAASWAIPGLILALIVMIIGASSGSRILVGAGATFLVVFVATYFYGVQVTMLTKSITLVASGIIVLLIRGVALKFLFKSIVKEATHA